MGGVEGSETLPDVAPPTGDAPSEAVSLEAVEVAEPETTEVVEPETTEAPVEEPDQPGFDWDMWNGDWEGIPEEHREWSQKAHERLTSQDAKYKELFNKYLAGESPELEDLRSEYDKYKADMASQQEQWEQQVQEMKTGWEQQVKAYEESVGKSVDFDMKLLQRAYPQVFGDADKMLAAQQAMEMGWDEITALDIASLPPEALEASKGLFEKNIPPEEAMELIRHRISATLKKKDPTPARDTRATSRAVMAGGAGAGAVKPAKAPNHNPRSTTFDTAISSALSRALRRS